MKKLLSLLLALVMIMSLSAAAFADSADEPSITLRFGLSNSADSVHGQNIQHMIDQIDKDRADGKTTIGVAMYPNNQLGNVDELLEMIMMGEDVVLSTDAGALKNWASDLAILEAPYFFENEEEPYLVFKTQWLADQMDILEEAGIKVLSCEMIYGSRHIMATAPIRTPDDMKGLKIRVPGNDLSVAMIEAMGGTATPMSLTEVYPSIQQGVIDGMENPFATHIDNNMWEVCDYLSLTGHQVTITWWCMSAEVFNSLSEEDQEYLMGAAADAAAYFNEINGKANEEALQTLKDYGVTVVDDVDIDAFKEATASVYDKFGYTELREEIYAQMDEFR